MSRSEEKCSGDPNTRRGNLIKFRDEKNWTRQQLSNETKLIDVDKKGISETTIYRLEKGKYNQKIHDNWRDLLSKAFKINPQSFDEPQSSVDNNNKTVTQNPPERSDAHANLRPFLSPFSKQENSQLKKLVSNLTKEFHYLGNLEKLSYEELWDHTKEYLLKIYNVTDDCTCDELVLVYSMTNDDSIINKIFNVCQPSGIHPDPILLTVLGNYSREPLNVYWPNEFKHLENQIDEYLEYINDSCAKTSLEVFPLAPQPLVVELGRRLSNIPDVNIYPAFKKNILEVGWGWYKGQHYISKSELRKEIDYKTTKPKVEKKRYVVLNLSLSSSILDQEIARVQAFPL